MAYCITSNIKANQHIYYVLLHPFVSYSTFKSSLNYLLHRGNNRNQSPRQTYSLNQSLEPFSLATHPIRFRFSVAAVCAVRRL